MTNDFLPFATAGGAPVLSQVAYAALVPANGYGAGLLPKENFNKAVRQGSAMAAAWGTFLNTAGQNANDDGDIATLAANIKAALDSYYGAGGSSYSGSAPAVLSVGAAAAAVGTVSVSGWRSDASGKRQWVCIQAYDDAGSTVCTWTFPNAALFATGIRRISCLNLASLAGQASAAHGGVISLLSQSATQITFYGHSTNVVGTKFWVFIEVEGY